MQDPALFDFAADFTLPDVGAVKQPQKGGANR